MTSPRIRLFSLYLAGVTLPLFLAVGCSTDSRSPMTPASTSPAADLSAEASAASQGGGFYPLTLGSQWRYHYTATMQLLPTGGPPGPPETQEWLVTHDLIVNEELFGRSYVVELQRTEVEGEVPYLAYVRYRQDRDGLYEADVPTDDPPGPGGGSARTALPAANRSGHLASPQWTRVSAGLRTAAESAAVRRALDRIEARRALLWEVRGRRTVPMARPGSGVLPGELLRLDYKLRPGASWTIQPDPLFTSTVEARERLSLAVGEERAFRVRVDSELFGPNDRVLTWYNTDGLLLVTAHFEEEATDEQGAVIGTLIGDDRKEATFINIAH